MPEVAESEEDKRNQIREFARLLRNYGSSGFVRSFNSYEQSDLKHMLGPEYDFFGLSIKLGEHILR